MNNNTAPKKEPPNYNLQALYNSTLHCMSRKWMQTKVVSSAITTKTWKEVLVAICIVKWRSNWGTNHSRTTMVPVGTSLSQIPRLSLITVPFSGPCIGVMTSRTEHEVFVWQYLFIYCVGDKISALSYTNNTVDLFWCPDQGQLSQSRIIFDPQVWELCRGKLIKYNLIKEAFCLVEIIPSYYQPVVKTTIWLQKFR